MAANLRVEAIIDNIGRVTRFVDEQLEQMGCSVCSMLQIDVVLDEIFSNVCHYAYGEDVGYVTVYVEELPDEKSVRITLEDEGVPFNPLNRKDPDITLGISERAIGGLGIFLVKRTMDDVLYEYCDGKNMLTIIKKL